LFDAFSAREPVPTSLENVTDEERSFRALAGKRNKTFAARRNADDFVPESERL
jgi:hypothetical protein